MKVHWRIAFALSITAHAALLLCPAPSFDSVVDRILIRVRLLGPAEGDHAGQKEATERQEAKAAAGDEPRVKAKEAPAETAPLPETAREAGRSEPAAESVVPEKKADEAVAPVPEMPEPARGAPAAERPMPVEKAEEASATVPRKREAAGAEAVRNDRTSGSAVALAAKAVSPDGKGEAAAGGAVNPAEKPGTGDGREGSRPGGESLPPGNPEGGARPGIRSPAPRDPFEIIRERIMAARSYPPLARKRGWEGRAKVRFFIGGNGLPEQLELIESSGRPSLDRASLRAVEQGAPYPSVPGRISVPIVFVLEE